MKIGILPCQGSCNVGVMTNKIAVSLVDHERINMVCPLGLPLGIESIINMAKLNDKHLALNGCSVKCASKALESANIHAFAEITLTDDFGIQKNKNFKDETKIDLVYKRVQFELDQLDLVEIR